MNLASALARLEEIASLPKGHREPAHPDDAPHLSEPWVPLPAECVDTVRALLFSLDADKLPLPVEIRIIAPYLGNGGVGLSWRDARRSIFEAPAVFLSVTLVAGVTCTVFENEVRERSGTQLLPAMTALPHRDHRATDHHRATDRHPVTDHHRATVHHRLLVTDRHRLLVTDCRPRPLLPPRRRSASIPPPVSPTPTSRSWSQACCRSYMAWECARALA